MPAQRRRPKPSHDVMLDDFSRHHERLDHFPSADELRELDQRWGIDRSLETATFALRFDRQMTRIAESSARPTELRADWNVAVGHVKVMLSPWILKLLAVLARGRRNQKFLDDVARDRFNQALQAAHADGSYQAMALIHSQPHMMHSSMGAAGTQRFLPWHREYLFKLEDLLRTKQPAVTIPYWDYANDHSRPDWVWQPPDVVRATPGAAGGSLPSQATVDSILLKASYSDFTYELERYAHNGVHSWCNGSLRSPSTAAQDPIFFLLHANADRIWDTWQLTHSGVPTVTGTDAVLDPWQPVTVTDVDDVFDMGYSYG